LCVGAARKEDGPVCQWDDSKSELIPTYSAREEMGEECAVDGLRKWF
jgi:hypothetical protein